MSQDSPLALFWTDLSGRAAVASALTQPPPGAPWSGSPCVARRLPSPPWQPACGIEHPDSMVIRPWFKEKSDINGSSWDYFKKSFKASLSPPTSTTLASLKFFPPRLRNTEASSITGIRHLGQG